MLDYELGNKLKQAGLKSQRQGLRQNLDGTIEEVIDPTLEELFEACGSKFERLERDSYPESRWSAYGWPVHLDEVRLITESGNSPTEAVANLWLALHKKE